MKRKHSKLMSHWENIIERSFWFEQYPWGVDQKTCFLKECCNVIAHNFGRREVLKKTQNLTLENRDNNWQRLKENIPVLKNCVKLCTYVGLRCKQKIPSKGRSDSCNVDKIKNVI